MDKKRWLALLLAGAMSLSLAACDDDEDYEEDGDSGYEDREDGGGSGSGELIGTSGDPDQTWAIYWYLCGSDLESDAGMATGDLEEMMEVDLPENVQVVIQTGGAWAWQNETVDADLSQRWVYSSEGLELVEESDPVNMGEASSLADFLGFCASEYPADHTMAIFWNHGGGSVAGVAFDEQFDYDALTLSELYEAFGSVYELSAEAPPLDVVGFDACLMGTIDVAYTFCDVARYLVASEEWEPGGGWLYSGFLQELADDPGMDGARLGQHICDSYYQGCEDNWVEDETTLSVVDLGAIGPLMDAYEALGAEALTYALEDPSFFTEFGRQAERTENYGGNTRDLGYTNMVDLGHLAQNCADILPQTSQAVQNALEDCVLYTINGPYRENATGLSCYYSYNADPDDFYGYAMEGCSNAFKFYFLYAFTGELPPEGMEYINSIGYEEEELPYVPDLEEDGAEDYPLYIDDEDYVTLELDMDIVNMLKGVYFQLAYLDPENDLILMLGQDNDIQADFDNGIFRDNFRSVWGAIDGSLVYMEVAYESDDYTAYAVPILLNGEEYNLRVIYDYNDEAWYILGARKGLEDNGMADKNLVQLKPGDELTTLLYASSISGDDDFEAVPVDTITVTEDTAFGEQDMGDGIFMMMFELVDAKNNFAYSEAVQFTVEGEYMDIEILE